MTIKNFRSIGLMIFLTSPLFAAPDAITNLSALSGAAAGTIVLTWTAPGGSPSATEYQVRYRPGSAITTNAEWDAANRVDQSPINSNPPTPTTPGNTQTMIVSNLEPGGLFGFSIKSKDGGGVFSGICLTTPIAMAKDHCSQTAYDGQGSAAVSPNSFTTGISQLITTTFTVGAQGISSDGFVTFRFPDYWYPVQTNNPGYPGYTDFNQGAGVTAGLVMTVASQLVKIRVSTGTLTAGQLLYVRHLAQTCDIGTNGKIKIQTQVEACGIPVDITGSPFTMTVGNGQPKFLSFETYEIPVQVNDPTAIRISARDYCGREVPAVVNSSFTARAMVRDDSWVFTDDPNALLSENISMTPSFTIGVSCVPASATHKILYYRITNHTARPRNFIGIQYNEFQPPNYPMSSNANTLPVLQGITNSSVDTGTLGALKTVSFSPDNDGSNDTVFIRATLPIPIQWKVLISSNPGFSTITRAFYGYGNTVSVAWDGFTEWTPTSYPGVAIPGTYYVKVAVQSDTLVDTSLSLTLTGGGFFGSVVSGTETIKDADISIWGPSSRYTRSDATGNFTVYGLRPGNYTVEVRKPGYATKHMTQTLSSGLIDLGSINLEQLSILRVTLTRSGPGALLEKWGGINAFTTDWGQNAYGTVHFGVGKVSADAGDYWNGTPTPYIDMTFPPNQPFSLRFQVFGLGRDDEAVSALAPGEIRSVSYDMTLQPNIIGKITLPAATANGTWVSVEAQNNANRKRFYGGVYIPNNEDNGIFTVSGVSNGTYTLKTFTQGYVPATRTTTVAGGLDATGQDMTLTEGGTLSGNLTVYGDTSMEAGAITVHLSAQPRSGSGLGSYKSVMLSTSTTESTTSYLLKGLEDGTYQIFAHLVGDYELFPPGPKEATVTGGSGSVNVALKKKTGVLQGQLTLPAPYVDYPNVKIDLLPYSGGFGGMDAGGAPRTPTIDGSGNYLFQNLGTGFYSLRAFHPATGNSKEISVVLVNGDSLVRHLALTDTTYKIEGTVTTAAASPFNSMDYYVNFTTPTNLATDNGAITRPAARIHARKVQDRSYYGVGNDFFVDTRKEFIGLVDSDGAYEIPNLSPGVYQVFNNAEMDNDFMNGRELASEQKTVIVTDEDVVGVDFVLQDGITISGIMQIKSGNAETNGRSFEIVLRDSREKTVAQKFVFLTGTSVSFSLPHIPPNETYTLAVQDFGGPKKYWVRGTTVKVESVDISNVALDLEPIGKIQLQLRVKGGEMITNQNFNQILTSGFYLQAKANPFYSNGYARTNYYPDANDNYIIPVGEGTYDIESRLDGFMGVAGLSQGKKSFVPLKLSGVEVKQGQTTNLGTIDLTGGLQISGNVSDNGGTAVPNLRVQAIPESGEDTHDNEIESFTDIFGKYTLDGLDPTKKYTVIASPYPEPSDTRYASGFDGVIYGEVRKPNIAPQRTTPLNFTVEPFTGSLSGTIKTPDNGTLLIPFDQDNRNNPYGGWIILNKKGDVPLKNPLGDIEIKTLPNGTFMAKGLQGIYDAWFFGKGYGTVKMSNIQIGTTDKPLGDVTLLNGTKLSGKILNSKGEAASTSVINTLVAVAGGFADLVIGNISSDTNGSISKYELSGFKTGTTYSILGFLEDKVISLGDVVVDQNSEKDLQISENPEPTILAVISKEANRMKVRFDLSDALYKSDIDADPANGIADSDDSAEIVKRVTGDGLLTPADEDDDGVDWISPDRKTLTYYYTPTTQGQFTLRIKAKFNIKDASTGENQSSTTDFTFYTGIGKEKTKKIPNATGGEVTLEDGGSFSPPAGTFGSNASQNVSVTLRSAATTDDLPQGQNPIAGALAVNGRLGNRAYPGEMATAMNKVRTMDVDPFSSFYDIFLPAGVSHFFPEGKEAKLCLAYDSSASDPSKLNIYYYNPSSNEYLLESENKLVDTANGRICVNISHASVFTILSSSLTVIAGGGYSGALSVMNFPNPFNLKSKTVTLQDPGSASASQTTEGTLIKASIPTGLSGTVEIQIFNVAGEKVRTLTTSVAGGTHYYIEWDGKNENGQKVASGTYIGRFTIDGGNELFFKMAALK